jgi:hypothetical protein
MASNRALISFLTVGRKLRPHQSTYTAFIHPMCKVTGEAGRSGKPLKVNFFLVYALNEQEQRVGALVLEIVQRKIKWLRTK